MLKVMADYAVRQDGVRAFNAVSTPTVSIYTKINTTLTHTITHILVIPEFVYYPCILQYLCPCICSYSGLDIVWIV